MRAILDFFCGRQYAVGRGYDRHQRETLVPPLRSVARCIGPAAEGALAAAVEGACPGLPQNFPICQNTRVGEPDVACGADFRPPLKR